MLVLLRIIAFVTVLTPCIGNAHYRLPDYPAYAPPPYALEHDGPMNVRDSDHYFEGTERWHEYRKRQFEGWNEYRKKQFENWHEYRKKQYENWHENRKHQFERWREFQGEHE
jgi:hypothetical protein